MQQAGSTEWFQVWFDSPYYPILYNHRDDTEAVFFLDHLTEHLKPSADSRILDLACGRGRHSIYLNQLGFDVTGVDLSRESIKQASAYKSDRLRFFEHDMRRPISVNEYDYVFNLFTSFGYFDRNHENQLVVNSIAKALKPGGTLILDFLNAESIRFHGRILEEKLINGIIFKISKEIRGGRVIKNIDIQDKDKVLHFEEKVSLLGCEEFEAYFKKTNLKVEKMFGDYSLNEFNLQESSRLIYQVTKP